MFAFLLLTGRYINDGPVVAAVDERHGVHAGDLFVAAGWLVALLAVVALLVTSRQGRDRRPRADTTRRDGGRVRPGAARS